MLNLISRLVPLRGPPPSFGGVTAISKKYYNSMRSLSKQGQKFFLINHHSGREVSLHMLYRRSHIYIIGTPDTHTHTLTLSLEVSYSVDVSLVPLFSGIVEMTAASHPGAWSIWS